ncbi:MAG TPA: argininosuccinate lyase [Candidatus Omnitrophota bacterium]|nr:argininosuccinate lyase [Candidatus Omnitrophota bacterium]HRZ15371.1 argininosuccinate lyase [Candidatus Omnitrophota bacterium]
MTKKLWGGRFKKEMNKDFYRFQQSIQYDWRLGMYDVFHSLIHIRALVHTNVLSASEAYKLERALADILKEIQSGEFRYHPGSEDIHTEIQNRLETRVGEIALKLHSFRSRNDQIAFDVTFFCVHEAQRIFALLLALQANLHELAREHKHDFFIGYTHTRRAQVIRFSQYLLGFESMLHRDQHRFDDFAKHTYVFIGSGALAGSYIKSEDYTKAITRFTHTYCKHLPVKISLVKNSLDNVSNRDTAIQFLSHIATLQMHLSRMAEDFILYSTPEFAYLELPEEFCTGSSYMPHKKNPDFLELVRGQTGRIYGNLTALLTTMKGLPSTYNRDMQLDKEPLFSSVDIIKEELTLMAEFVKGLNLNRETVAAVLKDETLYATEIAEFLVGKGVAFRKAHEIVGKLVMHAEDNEVRLTDMTDNGLKTFSEHLNKKVLHKIISPAFAVSSKRSLRR